MTDRPTVRDPTARAAADSLTGPEGTTVTGHEFRRTRVAPECGGQPAWLGADPGGDVVEGFVSPTRRTSYLDTRGAGHPHRAAAPAGAVGGRGG